MYTIRNAKTKETLGTAEYLSQANAWAYDYSWDHPEVIAAIFDEWDKEITGPEDVEDWIEWLQEAEGAKEPLSYSGAIQLLHKLQDQQRPDMPEWIPEIPYGMNALLLQKVWNEQLEEER